MLSAVEIARALGKPEPTAEQIKVIESGLDPLLVVAGAGSGKTETMAARVVYLVANKLRRPDQILGLTFTRKAAAELSERIAQRLSHLEESGFLEVRSATDWVPAPVRVATYNAFAGDLVRDHGILVGVNPDSRLITEAASWQIIDEIVNHWTVDLGDTAAVSTVVNLVRAMAGTLAEHALSIADTREKLQSVRDSLAMALPSKRQKNPFTGELDKVISQLDLRFPVLDIVQKYQDHKRAHNLLDFSDQVGIAHQIVASQPQVVKQLREIYGAVLLDEFQDTSVVQISFLAQLFQNHPLTAVGDPNQAIYGWRGASAASLETFSDRFNPGNPPREPLTLSTSWRNSETVLQVANQIAAPLRETAHAAVSPILKSRKDAPQGTVQRGFFLDSATEAQAVAEFFAQRRDPRRTAAILCRNRQQFTPLLEALAEKGVPTQVVGLGGMLFEPVVSEVVAALRVSEDAGRGDSLMRLLTGLGLGASDLHTLYDWATVLARGTTPAASPETNFSLEVFLADAVDNPPQIGWHRAGTAPERGFTAVARQRVQRLGTALRNIRAAWNLPLGELIETAIVALDLDIAAVAYPGDGSSRAALDAFSAVASGFAANAENPGPGAFLAWIKAAEQEERGLSSIEVEPKPGAVQLLTIHAAKGLEWDAVAVVGLTETQLPSYSGKPQDDGTVNERDWLSKASLLPHPLRGDAAYLPEFAIDGMGETQAEINSQLGTYIEQLGEHRVAEERRLAYVAFTRARSDLLLTGTWFKGEGSTVLRPSRFMDEVARLREVSVLKLSQIVAEAAPPTLEQIAERKAQIVSAPWPPPPNPIQQAAAVAAATVEQARPQVKDLSADDLGKYILQNLDTAPTSEDEDLIQHWLGEVNLLLRERETKRQDTSVVTPVDKIAATQVVNLLEDPLAWARNKRRPIPQPPSEAARLGTIFHAQMEQRLRAAATLLDPEDLGLGPQLNSAEQETLQGWIDTVWQLPFLKTHPVLAVEADLPVSLNGLQIPCRIDAVFASPTGRTLLVDWKTGRVPQTPSERQRAALQLHLYRLAWSTHHKVELDEVDAQLVYVASGEVRNWQDLAERSMTAAEMSQLLAAAIKRTNSN